MGFPPVVDDRVLGELLVATGGHAVRSGAAVGGVPARFVASPASTEEVAAVLRVATAHDLAVVARGAGTKLHWGAPPRRLDLIVDLGRLDRVVEHAAGDLVVTVEAGVPLAALADRLATEGQRLAVDEVVPGSTVGGVLGTGLSGPRRLLAGAVRDLVLGVTLVRADGVVAHAGGKVVKNVAGYDLAKLVTGAYGTLGIVTAATFRLHPVAAAEAYATAAYPTAAAAAAAVARVRHAQFGPTAVEVDRPDPAGPVEVAVLIEGTAAGVAARLAEALATLGPTATPSPRPNWWGALPTGGPGPAAPGPSGPEPAGAAPPGPAGAGPAGAGGALVKATAELTGLARLLDAAPGPVRGSAGVGAYHLTLPAERVSALRSAAPAWGGTVVVLSGPVEDRWGPVPGLELMRRVKERFDPGALLAPGRFVGGI
jgi:glycolate oxidase FAD binding subunit